MAAPRPTDWAAAVPFVLAYEPIANALGEGGASGVTIGYAEAAIYAKTEARARTGTKRTNNIGFNWYETDAAVGDESESARLGLKSRSSVGSSCALATPEKSARVANAVAPKSNFFIAFHSILNVCTRA